jgi:putative IMPACT (imprinted ancient) family translation regulator
VQQALKLLQTIEKKITTQLRVELDYAFGSMVQAVMQQFNAHEVSSSYDQKVTLNIEIELRHKEEFTLALINKSGAKVLVTDIDDN